jgi:iron complex outermembrane receptor protein
MQSIFIPLHPIYIRLIRKISGFKKYSYNISYKTEIIHSTRMELGRYHTMLNFKPNKVTLAILSSGMMALSASAFAAETEISKAEKEVEVITVTGIRGSLQRAQAIKMSTNSIVEVISAEDIGKLPDTSIAESLARLPGVTGERRNGRTSGLSIRGFNENYIGTTLNGRELLGMGDNRGVEFDLYPSEIVSSLVVYKTPEAGLLVQGIGGTIDLQTVSPLNSEKVLVINAHYEKNEIDSANPDFDNTGHKVSVNYVDKFADDTLGLALVISSLETPRQEENQRVWGYPDSSESEGNVVFGGHDSFVRSALLKRDSVAAVLEYAPTDNLKIQLDALYIDFDEGDVRRGIEEAGPHWGGGAYTADSASGGLVTSGEYEGFHSVVRNDLRTQQSELTTFGLNAEYIINDYWTAEVDLSTGNVDKKLTDIESYAGVGRGGTEGRPLSARSFQTGPTGVIFGAHSTLPSVDLTDPSIMRLAGPQSWGGGMAGLGYGDDAQDGFVNNPSFDESLDSISLKANGVVEFSVFSGVEVGLNYSEREKSKVNTGAFLTAPTYPGDGPVPNPIGSADLSFIGINGVIAYDSLSLYNQGFYTESDAALVDNNRLGDTYIIKEEITTAYAKLDIETELGEVLVSGNLGVQIIDVDQRATGYSTVSDENGLTNATPTSGGTSYTDILPSINLSFEIADNQFIRTAAAKVMSRPRLDQMIANKVVSFQFNDANVLSSDPENSAWSGTTGNPELNPLEANQFDLSYENYFAADGFFAVNFFYKDLVNWHRSGATLTDFSDAYIAGFHQSSDETGNQAPATFLGGTSFTEDGLEGFVRGYELQASVPMRLVHDSLEGFGVIASVTFIDGEFEDGADIPGLSDESYSFSAYYEKNGFEARITGTKRDRFATETRGLSLSLIGANDEGAELWDAQVSYDFSESGIESLDGLRITLQAQNLTDEKTIQSNEAGYITSYQSFGANYLLGLNYKF